VDTHARPRADRRRERAGVVEEDARMTAAKEEILGRIRAIDRGAPLPIERGYRRIGELASDALIELFAERVADYRADVRFCASGEVASTIESALLGHGARRVAVPCGLPGSWRSDSVDFVEDRELTARELDALDGVVTGCTTAIAETGTIVLAGADAEGGRALSLVPDLHVCVVRSTQIVAMVPEALAVAGDLVVRERRPLTFISGPSATSDIELSRVEGVHGPRTLIVLIVKEELP
jgi:L-lactate dehydrogenase complex protein LldG